MIVSVDFWPRMKTEAFNFAPDHAVISITDNEQVPALIKGTPDVLRLAFLDLEEAVDHPNFKTEYLFGAHHARVVADFVQRIHTDPEKRMLLVHCEAGVSRSAAVALYVEAVACCDFPNRGQTAYANRRVIKLLAQTFGLRIDVPDPAIKESNDSALF